MSHFILNELSGSLFSGTTLKLGIKSLALSVTVYPVKCICINERIGSLGEAV